VNFGFQKRVEPGMYEHGSIADHRD